LNDEYAVSIECKLFSKIIILVAKMHKIDTETIPKNIGKSIFISEVVFG